MSSKGRSLQTVFLDHVQARHVPVSIFLLNGVRLQGVVVGYDDFTIQIAYRGQVQTVYKQAISAIAPAAPIDLWEDRKSEPAEGAPAPQPAASAAPAAAAPAARPAAARPSGRRLTLNRRDSA